MEPPGSSQWIERVKPELEAAMLNRYAGRRRFRCWVHGHQRHVPSEPGAAVARARVFEAFSAAMLPEHVDRSGRTGDHRPRLPWPLASLAAAVCTLVPLLGAAPAGAQQNTIPDVCPGGELRGPKGECVPGTGTGESGAGQTTRAPPRSLVSPA